MGQGHEIAKTTPQVAPVTTVARPAPEAGRGNAAAQDEIPPAEGTDWTADLAASLSADLALAPAAPSAPQSLSGNVFALDDRRYVEAGDDIVATGSERDGPRSVLNGTRQGIGASKSAETERFVVRDGALVSRERRASTESASAGLDALHSAVGAERTREETTARDGQVTGTSSESDAATLAWNDGFDATHGAQSSQTHWDATGAHRVGRASQLTGGAVQRDGEVGARYASSQAETRDATTVTRASGGELTTRGAALEQSVGVGLDSSFRRRPEEAGWDGRLSAGLTSGETFEVDVQPVPGTTSHVVTVKIGLRGGGNGVAGGGYRSMQADVSARGSLSAEATFTRVLLAGEVQAYLGALGATEASGVAMGAGPEFGQIARLRAAGDNVGEAANAAVALADPVAAKAMVPGEKVVLSAGASGALGAGLGVGGQSAAIHAGGEVSAGAGRSFAAESLLADGRRVVSVTLTFDMSSGARGEVGGAFEGASLSVARSASRARQESVSVGLDPAAPDFDALYQGLATAWTRSQAEGVAAKAAAAGHPVTGVSATTSQSGAADTFGYGPISLGLNEGRSRTDTATRAADGGVTRGASLEKSAGGSLKVGDHEIGGAQRTLTAEASAGGFGAGVTATSRLLDLDSVSSMLGSTVAELNTRSRSVRFDERSVDALPGRAADAPLWDACAGLGFRAPTIVAWDQARKSVLAASGARSAPARRVGVAAALLDFLANADGTEGARVIENLSQRYGMTAKNSVPLAPVGALVEYPPSLLPIANEYEALDTRISAGAPADPAVLDRVREVERVIVSENEWENPDLKTEMVAKTQSWQVALGASGFNADDDSPVANLEHLLAIDKDSERRMLGRLTERPHYIEAVEISMRLERLWTAQMARVMALETEYEAAGVPPRSWRVSGSGSSQGDLMPAIHEAIALLDPLLVEKSQIVRWRIEWPVRFGG